MSTLCFGSFSRILKGATTTSNEFLIELLFTPFYHNDVTIDKADQSKLINSKKNVPVFIQNQADTPATTSMIEQYFRDYVVIHIKQSENYKLISLLVGIINGDNTIPEQQKSAFLSKADIEHLPSFLSDIFLYAIQQPNNLKENPIPPTPTDNSVYSIINGHIYLDGEEIKLPEALIPPENIEIEIPKTYSITTDMKNPIIIPIQNEVKNEHDLELNILANLDFFFKQLGQGFTYVAHQYKLVKDNHNYFVDILLFNYEFNAFVIIELKLRSLRKEDKAQIQFYMNLVDEQVKRPFHNKTIGIIISKESDKFIVNFIRGNDIIPLYYELQKG